MICWADQGGHPARRASDQRFIIDGRRNGQKGRGESDRLKGRACHGGCVLWGGSVRGGVKLWEGRRGGQAGGGDKREGDDDGKPDGHLLSGCRARYGVWNTPSRGCRAVSLV